MSSGGWKLQKKKIVKGEIEKSDHAGDMVL